MRRCVWLTEDTDKALREYLEAHAQWATRISYSKFINEAVELYLDTLAQEEKAKKAVRRN